MLQENPYTAQIKLTKSFDRIKKLFRKSFLNAQFPDSIHSLLNILNSIKLYISAGFEL